MRGLGCTSIVIAILGAIYAKVLLLSKFVGERSFNTMVQLVEKEN